MSGYYDRDRNPRTAGTEAMGTYTAAGTMNHPMTHYGNTAEFLVAGWPYIKNHTSGSGGPEVVTINFPYVTQFIQITSLGGTAEVRFKNGGTSVFKIPTGTTVRLDVKVVDVFITVSASDTISLCAGLTNVDRDQFPDITGFDGVK